MKTLRLVVPVLLMLSLLVAPAAAAGAADVPPPLAPTSGRLSERYPVWSYTLDGDYSYQDFSGRLIGTGLNFLVLARAWLVYAALRGVEYAAQVELAEPLTTAATAVQHRLESALWAAGDHAWVTAALVVAGAMALLTALVGRRTRAYRILFGAGGTLLIALWLLAALPALLMPAQTLVRSTVRVGLEPVVALLPGDPGPGPGPRLLAGPGEMLWRVLVYDPWIWAEFGGPKYAANYPDSDGLPGGRVLAMLPSARQNFYEQQPGQRRGTYFAWWTGDYTVRRLVLAVVLLLVAAASVGLLLLLAGEILLYQLFLSLWVAMAPIWLLAALWWPGGGLGLLRRWLLRGAGALLLQVVLSLALGVALVLAFWLDQAFAAAGWLVVGLLQAVLVRAVYHYRRQWLRLLAGRPVAAVQPYPLLAPAPAAAAEGSERPNVPAPARRPPATAAPVAFQLLPATTAGSARGLVVRAETDDPPIFPESAPPAAADRVAVGVPQEFRTLPGAVRIAWGGVAPPDRRRRGDARPPDPASRGDPRPGPGRRTEPIRRPRQ